MNISYSLHKTFLICILSICAVLVALFVRQQASAADSLPTASSAIAPINGVCSSISGTKSTTKPSGNLCASGTASAIIENNVGWVWRCTGINGGTNSYCSVSKYVPTTTATTPTATPTTSTTTTADTTRDSSAGTSTTSSTVATDTATPASTPTNTASIANTTTSATATGSVTTSSPAEVSKSTETVSSSGSSEIGSEEQKVQVTETVSQPESENVPVAVQSGQQNFSQEAVTVEKSQIVTAPVIIAAKNLEQKNNPKLAGVVDAALKIEKVSLVENNNGAKQIALSGKSQPNAIVWVYIFSSDPIVISLKADANGDWNYELDKELADGQHEVYVAVADEAGKIISKSEPIAFVKTAQAANMIPLSELESNQSPMENSTKQFVLMAIIVMSICLAIALAAIGFLTHKQSFNEGIN